VAEVELVELALEEQPEEQRAERQAEQLAELVEPQVEQLVEVAQLEEVELLVAALAR